MNAHVATVELPEDLIREIDSVFGPASRSAFLIETAQAALHRHKLLEFLKSDEPAWKDEDHPELVELGTQGWVRALREESDQRIPAMDMNERTED